MVLPRQPSARAGSDQVYTGAEARPPALLATVVADPYQRRLALTAVAASIAAFLAAVPFARVPLAPLPAFIPAYEASLVVVDLITAVLLFGQFAQIRSAALLALASGYLFDALMTVGHALSFPGLITPTGWLGAGSQTTAWLYMFWHGGFPLFVIAYAGLRRADQVRIAAWSARFAVIAAIGVAAILTLVATEADRLLPPIMTGNAYTAAMELTVGTVWALTAAALLALVLNRPYSVLDLWLIVVMVAWLADIGLSAVFNAGRFDLGFYGGRLYGLLAASFVLGVVLVEAGGLYRRLAIATTQLEQHARELGVRVRQGGEELARANRQLNAILEASPVGIYMLDGDGKVTLWTAAAERIYGYTEAEALGRLPPQLDDPQAADFRQNLARAIAEPSATGSYETRRRRKDGVDIDASVRWARVNDADGRMLGVMYAVGDITERKKLETQLRQAQKMEAVGTLTGGLAHDFNNHLGVIILNLDVLRERLPADDEEADELTREAMAAAMRGAELIRRLLAFARRQPLQPQRTDINTLVAEMTKLLERTLGENIKITLDLAERVWPTVIDPAQLESSLANLATNARDAMPHGGGLTIATGNRRLDEDYASVHAEVKPGDYAMVEVNDSGGGMPPEVLAKVFEPFFTTKAPGKGTGLGLSMVYGFIKQSGGHINVYSELGVGTTVRLYLPRGDADGETRAAAPIELARGSGETVLAVEDNPSLRRVVVRQLGEIGYRVLEAETAGAALELLEREPVAVVFTDVVLPGGMNGYELARVVLERWPGSKIVLTSGFPENRIAADGELDNVKLLSKPYRKEDIARVIREALKGGASR